MGVCGRMTTPFSARVTATRWGALHQKHVTGYDRAFTNPRIASKDGAIGINDHMIFNRGMTLYMFDGASLFIQGKLFAPSVTP